MRKSGRSLIPDCVTRLILVLLILSASVATASWDVANDFNKSSNQSGDTWRFFQISDGVEDGSYDPVSTRQTDFNDVPGLGGWQGKVKESSVRGFPFVLRNSTGSPVDIWGPGQGTVPTTEVTVHPWSPQHVAIGWKSPITGRVDISGRLYISPDTREGGNGVDWFVDKGNMSGNLASGTLAATDRIPEMGDAIELSSVPVTAGDMLYLIVHARGDVMFDATNVSLKIRQATETASVARADSRGNTDGIISWQIGTLAPQESSRRVVLFAFDKSHKEVLKRLDEARQRFATLGEPPTARAEVGTVEPVRIKNAATDFALAQAGHFNYLEGKSRKQSLACSKGGQLSRFAYYAHYNDGVARRAGTPITAETPGTLENLRIVQPVRPIDPSQAVGVVETTDRKLRLQIHAIMGAGPMAAVAFVVTNTANEPLSDVKLSVLSNIESAHTPDDDFCVLDRATGGVLVVDPASGMCVVMAGLDRPSTGHTGTWPSGSQLEAGLGVAAGKWQAFTAMPQELTRRSRESGMSRLSRMPYPPATPPEPAEPETRDLTPEEAKAVLRRDWLFQADNEPTVDHARQEIKWARELAARLKKNPDTPDLSGDLAELDALDKHLAATEDLPTDSSSDPLRKAERVYLAVRRVKRRIMFENPVVDFSQVLFIEYPYSNGREWPHQVRHRNGMMAIPGGRQLVLDGMQPGGHLRRLGPEKPGAFWRPDLSFDARRVLFCYKAYDEKSFHLYETDLDGSGMRQLSFGDYDDIDPIYLPDGHIMFTTTRCNTYVRCMPYSYCYVLARCDADGKNVYLISRNSEPDWCPSLLNDGRVIYSRWEYHDKALWRIQSLWTTGQDGTGTATFWGNQSVWPDHLAEPRAIPGSQRVMFTGLAHHDWFAGSIGIIDPRKGFNFPHGLTKVTCDVPWPECGRPPRDPHEADDYHSSGAYTAYKTPYPLSEEDFLVSARSGGLPSAAFGFGHTAAERAPAGLFKLYLMDVYGNRELIYESCHNVLHAVPVRTRRVPPAQPDCVAWPGTGKNRQTPEPGVMYNADVYQGVPDLPPGTVKYLRVLQMDARTYSSWLRDGRFSGPVVSAVQDDGVKRILGTVPVQPDGSVAFKVPAGRALHFQLLDGQYRALHTMRSFNGVMPGERRGCIGCHEQHSAAPVNRTSRQARQYLPAELTPPPWGAKSISYEQLVQPVLDRYCGNCHQGDGEARKDFDLTLRPAGTRYRELFTRQLAPPAFKEPYLSLIGQTAYSYLDIPNQEGIAGAMKAEDIAARSGDPSGYETLRPMTYLSYTSPLIELASGGKHHDVKVDPLSLRQLIGWVDSNCPYRSEEEIRAIADPDFPSIDVLPIRPRVKTSPIIPRP